MKLRILSDLHTEFADFIPPKVEADAVLLAGDIGAGFCGLNWAAKHFAENGETTIYVPGNHEYYGCDMETWQASAADFALERNILFGDNASFLLTPDGEPPVRVLAATLWTDFALFGAANQIHCAKVSQQSLLDYQLISYAGRALHWPDTQAFHEQAMAWLKAEVKKANEAGEKVVVVTHHAPSLKSTLPCYLDDPVSAAFASNLEAFAAEHIDLWVHGHMHNSSDYIIGRCRVVANPRGYPRTRWQTNPQFENKNFDPGLVVPV